MSKNYFIPLIALFFISSTIAQEKVLTKEAAVAKVLEQNFGILMAKNTVDIADNNQSILNSGYLPTLSGAANATYNRDDATIEFPGQFQRDAATNDILIDADGNAIPRPDVNLSQAEAQRYGASLNLNYTLFDGMGRFYTFKRLKEQYALTTLQARETIENTVIQLFSVYFQVARLTENEKVITQSLTVSKDRLKRAEYAFDYGQSTKLDVLNATVDVTTDSISKITIQQQLANAKRDLNVVLNQDLATPIQVDTVVAFTSETALDSFLEDAAVQNVAVAQAIRSTAINEYDIKVANSGYLPRIGLSGSYGWNLNQSAASAFFPGTNNTTNNFNLGASLSWNLFDGGATTVRIKNAKLALENANLMQQQLELQVKAQIRNAQAVFENSFQVYIIQQQNVRTNERNFERSKEQFQLGSITSIEFRQAQLNLLNAQTNYTLAKYDAKLAELQLLQLTGQLLNVSF